MAVYKAGGVAHMWYLWSLLSMSFNTNANSAEAAIGEARCSTMRIEGPVTCDCRGPIERALPAPAPDDDTLHERLERWRRSAGGLAIGDFGCCCAGNATLSTQAGLPAVQARAADGALTAGASGPLGYARRCRSGRTSAGRSTS
jgi:hypothetical protein